MISDVAAGRRGDISDCQLFAQLADFAWQGMKRFRVSEQKEGGGPPREVRARPTRVRTIHTCPHFVQRQSRLGGTTLQRRT